MTERSLTLLAFDFGEMFTGVAVGQTLTATANPLQTVYGKDFNPDWAAISELINTWRPDELVVGLPLNMDGSEQAMTHAARRFRRQLQGRYALPVHMCDERLSTREARRRVRGQPVSADSEHSIAAQIILEAFLAERQLQA